jgi:ParB family chromosome partitioning protein
MSKLKLSELVKKNTSEPDRASTNAEAPAETVIPAADVVQGGNTAIQKTLKYKEIDPSKCRPWAHHNRPDVWLTPDACASLIESIKKEGQQELGLVREVRGEQGVDYEIIFGMRRWYAASQIDGAKFRARVTDANDQECALLMHVENEESEDISEFEKALSFEELIQAKIFKTQSELADSLRVKKPYISKLLRAARLFSVDELRELLKPFTRELSVQKAIELVVLIEDKKTRDKVVNKALELGSEEGAGLARILTELKKAPESKARPAAKEKEKCHFSHGKKPLLTTAAKPNGKQVLTLDPDFLARAGEKAESILQDAVKEMLASIGKS